VVSNPTQRAKLAENIVERVRDVKYTGQVPRGLYPILLNPHTGAWQNSKVSFGAMGDSWYEYLLKVWVMGGRTAAMKGWNDEWVGLSLPGVGDCLHGPPYWLAVIN
jgi:hypothetical protein